MNLARKGLLLLMLTALPIAAAGCEIVGQGQLHVANDLSGIGRDNTVFYAFAPEAGDPFPASGQLALAVRGDDFGHAPSYGMNGYLYLVSTNLACPMSEGAPEAFELSDVTIVGIVTVTNGTVNQVLTMADTPQNRDARWALIEVNEFPGFEPQHAIQRCGTVTWS